MCKRVAIVVGVVVAVVLGLGACAFGGDAVSKQQENLANQREVAVDLLRMQGGVERIRFTNEGGAPGLGSSWGVNAVVTIGGADYHMILTTLAIGGDRLPDIPPQSPPIATRVIYSDGSSEVIK